jgi:hypothetical protein
MTTFFPITLTCPVCGKDFKSQSVGSCGHGSKRTDFRPNYWGANPVRYFYHNCPDCGYCNSQNFFKKEFKNQQFKEKIKSMGPLEKGSSGIDLSTKIERAMHCLEVMRDFDLIDINDFAMANNWINAYWWAENQQSEKRFGEITLDYFERAFDKDLIPENQYLTIMYLRGEIHRRIGNFKKAVELFRKVIDLGGKFPDPNNIVELAEKQKSNPKEDL